MITDYLSLQDEIKAYLYNRKDLDAQIPNFIAIAERKIFRTLRCPENEAIFNDKAPDNDVLDQIPQPADFAEVKMLRINSKPLERVSERELEGLRAIDFAAGEPSKFARVLNNLKFWRLSDSNYDIELYYWTDLSGALVADTDTNAILTKYPDLYLYGSLIESMPFLVDDGRLMTWQEMYSQAMEYVNNLTIEQEYSGSPGQVSSVYPDPIRGHQRGRGTNG